MRKKTDLATIWKELDFSLVDKAIIWSLNVPECLEDDSCFPNWLKWGKQLVKEGAISLKHYREQVKKEEFRRRERKISREIDMEKREARLIAAFGDTA